MSITLEKNGLQKRIATGYSFKNFCFGCLYPLATGDYKGAGIQFALATITFGASWIVTPFVYNRIRLKRLIEDGYKPFDTKTKDYLIKKLKWSE